VGQVGGWSQLFVLWRVIRFRLVLWLFRRLGTGDDYLDGIAGLGGFDQKKNSEASVNVLVSQSLHIGFLGAVS